jgi:hypothetical protein
MRQHVITGPLFTDTEPRIGTDVVNLRVIVGFLVSDRTTDPALSPTPEGRMFVLHAYVR